MTKQVRFISVDHCHLNVREDGEESKPGRHVDGTPIVFGMRSGNLTPWSGTRVVYEVLEPGCITAELLQRSDIILNINHSSKVTDVLGRYRNGKGTLELELNPANVKMACELPHTNCADDTLELIKRGDISGMSFEFEDDWEDSENGVSFERLPEKTADGKEIWIRHVKRIKGLYDVSIVTHPAYEQTSVYNREQGDDIMKSIEAQIEKQQRSEEEADDKKKKEEDEKKAAEEKAAKEAEEREMLLQMEHRRRQRELDRMKLELLEY